MGRKSKKNLRDALQSQLDQTNSNLGELNRELAAHMIQLAGQTGDTAPLIDAVQALRKAKTYYKVETAPQESVEIQQAIADTLLALGRKNEDRDALESALEAYRSAITLASLIGDEDRRQDLKINYKLATNFLGQHRPTPSLFKVA